MTKVINSNNIYKGCITIEKNEIELEKKKIKEKEMKDEKDILKELNNATIDLPNISF